MRYVWLAIIAVGLIPVAVTGFLLNPLVLFVNPYRSWIAFSIGVCAFSTAVYSIRWG